MKRYFRSVFVVCIIALFALPPLLSAQVTKADYERATGLREKLQGLAIDLPERPSFIGTTNRFWYRKTVAGGERDVVGADFYPGGRYAILSR